MTPQMLNLTDELRQIVLQKSEACATFLAEIARDYAPATVASSLGAEDMILTDLVLRHKLPLEIFSLDTGRLPLETYELMDRLQKHYGLKLKVFYPQAETLQNYVQNQGINAFYTSVDSRKTCCAIRKVEPLQRALTGHKAWITGLRTEQSTTRTALPLSEFDSNNQLQKFNPLASWSEKEVWAYIKMNEVPYNALHDKFYPSIGCAPCTRPVSLGEDVRAGRWWWENPESKECGLHIKKA